MPKKEFKANAVRTVTSPSNEKITTYFTWVDFKDIPNDISLDVNPRTPKMTTSVAKQLIKAVKDPDTDFDINNRGIVITAKSFKFRTHDSMVVLDLGSDDTKFGILDGGHTYKAIIQNRNTSQNYTPKFVRLEIIVGEDLDVSALADARNTSVQVSDIALFELDDKFGKIKNAISNEKYSIDVAYKDNDDKRIQILEFLKLMFAFNIDKYPDDSGAPVSSYSGKANVFKDYKNEYDKENNIYNLLADELVKLVELYEIIYKEMPVKYQEYKKENGEHSKFGRIRGIQGRGDYKTPFTESKVQYEISAGFLLPIFGSFRVLIKKEKKTNKIKWEFDPKEVWDIAGTRLVQNTFETDKNPQLAGKNKTLWQSNYRIVDGIKKDLIIQQLKGYK
jgi:hypothetical protein